MISFFSVFEQFQYHYGSYEVEAVLWWLTALLVPLNVYNLDEIVSLGEFLSWVDLIMAYGAAEFSAPILNTAFFYFNDSSTLCVIVNPFFGDTLVQKIVFQCLLIFGYLTSNWLSSVLIIGFFVFWILFLWPVSVTGNRRLFVGLCNKIFSSLYLFFYDLVYSYLKDETRYFFPFIFYLFLFISFFNLCGMIPYSLTLTSHLIVTFSIAVISWGGVLLCGIERHGVRIFSIFYPNGLSFSLVPFVCLIEVVSHLTRVVSLALRLFSNIVAGHILLDLVSIFLFKLTVSSFLAMKAVVLFFGMAIVLVLFFFECAICLLQAYIFAVLSCIYCSDYVQCSSH